MISNPSLYRVPDGRNHVVTFTLASSLFLGRGSGNGMVYVMDKLFGQWLHPTLAQSAGGQFAHYRGDFLIALPTGYRQVSIPDAGASVAGGL